MGDKLRGGTTIGGNLAIHTGNINLSNAGTATKLQTARTINGVSFDGTANITVEDSTKIGATNYATSTTGGVVKVRLSGKTAYITSDGSDA